MVSAGDGLERSRMPLNGDSVGLASIELGQNLM